MFGGGLGVKGIVFLDSGCLLDVRLVSGFAVRVEGFGFRVWGSVLRGLWVEG